MLYKIAALFFVDGIIALFAAFIAIDIHYKFGVSAFCVGIALVLLGIQAAFLGWILGV